ncbi:MAG TPA: class I SAM-dependent methyltransferase [Firmicutes bacterium]|nr:class I SAM-dependent methyltransferase [Bacillota bacterium]
MDTGNCPSAYYARGILEPITGFTLRPGGLDLTRQAVNHCRFPKGAKILDIGCGYGETVRLLRSEYGFNAVGLDTGEKMLQKARARYPDLTFVAGRAENLPFPGGELDAIFMECTFSLLNAPDIALSECHRTLKRDGRLVISDFYYRNREGFRDREYYEKMLAAHGFRLQFWEDKSECLTQLLVNCIMQQYDTEILWQCLLTKEENKKLTCSGLKKFKPGYFLLVAEKNARAEHTAVQMPPADRGGMSDG